MFIDVTMRARCVLPWILEELRLNASVRALNWIRGKQIELFFNVKIELLPLL
jgi:hypothetical protein